MRLIYCRKSLSGIKMSTTLFECVRYKAVGRSENQKGHFKKKVLNRILFRPKPEELIVPSVPPVPTGLEEVHESSEIVEDGLFIDNGKEVHEPVLFIDNGKEVHEVAERVKEIKSVFIDDSKKIVEDVHEEMKEEKHEVSEIKEKVHEVSFDTEDQVKDESSETDISTSPNDSPAPSHFSLSTLGLKSFLRAVQKRRQNSFGDF